jgi:hypothetical protein
VLESLVWSSFLASKAKTETETGLLQLMNRKKPDWTNVDRSYTVFCGYKTGLNRLQSQPVINWSRPVLTGFIKVLGFKIKLSHQEIREIPI